MPKIIIEARGSDYMAYIEGHQEHWECSTNPFAAVGMLLVGRKIELGIEVQFPASAPPALRLAAK